MTEHLSSKQTPFPKTRKISIQERSARVGNLIVVNGYRTNLALLQQRFTEGGYQFHETSHFLLFLREQVPSTILIHWFAPDTLEPIIQQCLSDELAPFDLFMQTDDQSALLEGILDSFHMPEVRIYDHSVPVGDMWVMNGSGLDRRVLKRRFFQNGYQVQET